MKDHFYPSNRVSEGVTIKTMPVYEHYFEGRKPSKAQVIQSIKRGLSGGFHMFEISWGENMVTLDRQAGGRWAGWGWIKNISGDDLANQLNQEGV
jgi:hypothetical protein